MKYETLNTTCIYNHTKDMAHAEGKPDKNTSVYYVSVHHDWEIRTQGTRFWFVSSAGLSNDGHHLYRWTEINIGDAMIMKKADIVRGKINDSGPTRRPEDYNPASTS